MIKSMTGYGRGEYKDETISLVAEMRSVNHRYLDISVKMPRKYGFAEDAVKSLIKSRVSRGKIELYINAVESSGNDTNLLLNMELAEKYMEKLSELSRRFPELSSDMSVRSLASLPDVLVPAAAEQDQEAVTGLLLKAVGSAVDNYEIMRAEEGRKLSEDLLYRNGIIEETRQWIAVYAPEVSRQYALKLKDRIAQLIGENAEIPEDRIMLEAAVFADKSDITEELTRLKSHTAQFESFISESAEPVGKKLDFLVQEMNRESNTIGSKANDSRITADVLVLKAEIEKIREQIQNIE